MIDLADGTHRHVDVTERRARLAGRHLLIPETAAPDAAAVVSALGALHATDPATPHLSVALRLRDPDRGALGRALLSDRSLIRHHAMRRTLWIVDRALVGVVHAACTRAIAVKEWNRFAEMLRENGVADPDSWLATARPRALDVVRELGTCTARELGVAAPELAIPLELSPGKPYSARQGAHTRVVQNLGFDGAIVRTESVGSWVSGEYRWVVAEEWIPGGLERPSLDTTAACATLAETYLRTFGPATSDDLQWWTGWTATVTRRALEAVGAVPVSVDGDEPGEIVPAWLLPDDLDPVDAVDPWATILPSLDPTVMGWKRRRWYTGEHGRFGHTVFDRNGNAGNSIVADGRMVGTWAQRPDGSVTTRYLERVPATRRALVDESIDRYLTIVDGTVVRPRYPAPLQRDLLEAGV